MSWFIEQKASEQQSLRLDGIHMRLKRLSQIAAVAMLYGATPMAAAQQPSPPLFPPCLQSTIAGQWEMFGFEDGEESLGGGPPPVCPIVIAANGAVSSAQCESPGVTTPPSGTLTVDPLCHVTGNISFTMGGVTYSASSMSMWLSADGSRISGYGNTTNTYGYSYSAWYELIYQQTD
jgi:hypothetical protein